MRFTKQFLPFIQLYKDEKVVIQDILYNNFATKV